MIISGLKESGFLATMNSFRSTSLIFSSPENLHCNNLVSYAHAHTRIYCAVTSHTVIKCNRRDTRVKFLAHAQTVGTRLYFPPPHDFRAWVRG